MVDIVAEDLKLKARNYFLLGTVAERLGMTSESASNWFKALFALDDYALSLKLGKVPKDHTERFIMLKASSPVLYEITDRVFSTYRRTYTQNLRPEELLLVKKRLMEAFENAKVAAPTDEEIKNKLKELVKKGA